MSILVPVLSTLQPFNDLTHHGGNERVNFETTRYAGDTETQRRFGFLGIGPAIDSRPSFLDAPMAQTALRPPG